MRKFLTLLIFASACSTGPEVPKEVLQPDKMQAVMQDILLVDGRIANSLPADSVMRKPESRYRMYRQVLQLHGTSQQQFASSMKFYEQHPPLLQDMLDKIDKDLTKQMQDTTRNKPGQRPLPQ